MDNTAVTEEERIEALAGKVLNEIALILQKKNQYLSAVQQLKLDSHIRAMARRSLTGETLPEFDITLFDEISDEAMQISHSIVALFNNLPSGEAYLLSIHFEMAKNIN